MEKQDIQEDTKPQERIYKTPAYLRRAIYDYQTRQRWGEGTRVRGIPAI